MDIGVDAFHSIDISNLLIYLISLLKGWLNSPSLYAFLNSLSDKTPAFVNQAIRISFFISGVALFFVIYYGFKIWKMLENDKAARNASQPVASALAAMSVENKNRKRWNLVIEHVNSEEPNNWKMAVLEADIMLDEMLDIQQYHGQSVGDKLKLVEKSDFNTIDMAWEAHKVRNQIAHEGNQFMLSQREARRVVNLYEQVFNEFEYI